MVLEKNWSFTNKISLENCSDFSCCLEQSTVLNYKFFTEVLKHLQIHPN